MFLIGHGFYNENIFNQIKFNDGKILFFESCI